MKISEMMLDKEKKANGTWIDIVDDFKIKVRPQSCEEFQAMHKRLMKPYENIVRHGREVPADKSLDIYLQCVAETCLLDWKGLHDDAGKEIKYSKAAALKYLRDAEIFRNNVSWAIQQQDFFKAEAKEAAAKN